MMKQIESEKTEKPVKTCHICQLNFGNKNSLANHRRIEHAEETKLHCNICQSSHSSKTGLRLHMKVHQENKLYICQLCGFEASLLRNLQSHERNMHKNNKNHKKFECEICGKTLTTKKNSVGTIVIT